MNNTDSHCPQQQLCPARCLAWHLTDSLSSSRQQVLLWPPLTDEHTEAHRWELTGVRKPGGGGGVQVLSRTALRLKKRLPFSL